MGYDSIGKIASVGPKGENGLLNGQNIGCMFGPNIINKNYIRTNNNTISEIM